MPDLVTAVRCREQALRAVRTILDCETASSDKAEFAVLWEIGEAVSAAVGTEQW